MTKEEYFKEWLKVIPIDEMNYIISKLAPIKNNICPAYKDIFIAFKLCNYNNLKVIILGQDPYPQKGVATGIAFANSRCDIISPLLEVIKESVVNYEIPHNFINFANDLEEWEKQGVLLLNTALTCIIDKPKSHSLLWRPFITKLIKNICECNTGMVFLLLGKEAQSFKTYISKNQHIIEANHPSYYYRNNEKMPYNIWKDINKILIGIYGYGINFYKEQ